LHGLSPLETATAAAECFRPDFFRAHIAPLGADLPLISSKPEGANTDQGAIASQRGQLILGPDAFFDGKICELPPA
jgi:two-component system, oxyanion-binding sensor